MPVQYDLEVWIRIGMLTWSKVGTPLTVLAPGLAHAAAAADLLGDVPEDGHGAATTARARVQDTIALVLILRDHPMGCKEEDRVRTCQWENGREKIAFIIAILKQLHFQKGLKQNNTQNPTCRLNTCWLLIGNLSWNITMVYSSSMLFVSQFSGTWS